MPIKRVTKKRASSRAAGGRKVAKVAARRPAATRRSASKKASSKKAVHSTRPTVLVVNMIPRSLSGEEHQDSEPSIAVNPANPLQIAASAFTPDPSDGPRAPIFVSTDGGNTWTLNSIVPGNDPMSGTHDVTLKFGAKTNVLYAGILRGDVEDTRMNILRTGNFTSATGMSVLVDRGGQGVDQPYVQATTVSSGADQGKDRLYVGDNDFNAPGGRTATIDQSLNAAAAGPSFKTIRLESRTTGQQDGPPIRPAIHSDGTVYAVYHSWRRFNSNTGGGAADIVVVRDDHGGTGAKPFTDLLDSGDLKPGVRVATNTKFNFDGFLGLQRTGGDVSIAVDPTNSDRVYVAYNDDRGQDYVLHLLRSTNRGSSWMELRTITNALNPALAVNSNGKLAVLYQQLTGAGASQRWVTRVITTTNGTSFRSITLARVPARSPAKQFDPYLGDYDHMMAVGKDFYGVFSANNTPAKFNFPRGVKYQRNANFSTKKLLGVDGVTPVLVSIDPFFFKVTG